MSADVTIVGAGVIALATAAELADRGARVRLIGTTHRGEASSASAGMLAPSLEAELGATAGAAHHFAIASRDAYPAYLAMLESRTGIPVPLNRLGILDVAFTEEELAHMGGRSTGGATTLDARELAALEPGLGPTAGALLHPYDGALDPLLLLDALRMLVSRHDHITVHPENVRALHTTADRCHVVSDRENHYTSATVVLAAGAWTPCIEGVPLALPVEPVRGQMVAYGASVLRHVVYGPRGYLVPKTDGNTLVGSTMERVGFDASTSDEGLAALRSVAEELAPALRHTPVSAFWAGLRPITPDYLPILGPDPAFPNVIYACGHSRNGILLTPLTARVIADLVSGEVPQYDLGRFRPDRF